MPCPQFPPMVTSYKTVAAHAVLKGSSSPSLSSGEKLSMEALSSHPNQSSFRGIPPVPLHQAPQQMGAISILRFINDFIFEFAFCKWSWRNSGACPGGLEPWLMVVPPPWLWGMGCWPLCLLLLPCDHCCLPCWVILGVGAWVLGQWGSQWGSWVSYEGLHMSGKYP